MLAHKSVCVWESENKKSLHLSTRDFGGVIAVFSGAAIG
jgi:hypothetical protein